MHFLENGLLRTTNDYCVTAFQYDYDYSIIDGSIIDKSRNTFDTNVTLKYIFGILGVIGLMLILGVGFDIYNLLNKPDKTRNDSTGDFTHRF